MNYTKHPFKYLFVMSLIYTVSIPVIAQDTTDYPLKDLLKEVPFEQTLTERQLVRITEELRLQSLIIESVDKIGITNGEIINYAKAQSATRDIILQTSLSHYVFRSEVSKKRFSDAIKKIFTPKYLVSNLKELVDIAKRFGSWQKKSFVSASRTQGLMFAMVKFVSIQLDTTIPMILLGSGNFVQGAALLASPVSPIALFPFKVIKDTVKNIVLIKRLGLKNRIKQYKIQRAVNKRLKIDFFKTTRLINTFFGEQQYILNIQIENTMAKYLNRKHYKRSLNLENLTKFMSKFKEYNNTLTQIKNSRVSNELKLYTLIGKIEHSADSAIIESFMTRFKDSFFMSKNIDIPSEHRRWFYSMSHAKNFETFYWELLKMPENLHPHILDDIWRKYVIPKLSQNIEAGYFATNKTFSNLIELYDKELRLGLSTTKDTYLLDYTRKRFISIMYKALKPMGPCSFMYKVKGSQL